MNDQVKMPNEHKTQHQPEAPHQPTVRRHALLAVVGAIIFFVVEYVFHRIPASLPKEPVVLTGTTALNEQVVFTAIDAKTPGTLQIGNRGYLLSWDDLRFSARRRLVGGACNLSSYSTDALCGRADLAQAADDGRYELRVRLFGVAVQTFSLDAQPSRVATAPTAVGPTAPTGPTQPATRTAGGVIGNDVSTAPSSETANNPKAIESPQSNADSMAAGKQSPLPRQTDSPGSAQPTTAAKGH